MLALSIDGKITECKAKIPGNGRCTHIAHKKGNMKDFINEINKDREYISPNRVKSNTITDLSEKKKLSGNFESCKFIKEDKFEKLIQFIHKQEDTQHNKYDNIRRNYKVDEYEKDFSGIPCEMFLVDRNHSDGKELHIIKNNGIIEIYNMQKLFSNKPSLITKLIARPSQIKRYYTWQDCDTPKYLTDIAKTNQNLGRNMW